MAGMFVGGMERTIQKLSSLLPSAIPASSSSTFSPSEGQTEALEDFKALERTMRRIQAVLTEVHKSDIGEHCEKHQLEELKEVAYDAEDVVGDYGYDVMHAKIEARDKMLGLDGSINRLEHVPLKVIDLDSIRVSVPVSDEIVGKVKVIIERFEEITKEWQVFHSSERDAQPKQKKLCTSAHPPCISLVQESTIYGRHEDKENIIQQIFSKGKDYSKVSVIPIVGTGGIGKTTLAQLIYNDVRVCKTFKLKGWVSVSEDFDVSVLTKRIIASFSESSCELSELDSLQLDLKKKVQHRRFFLVLDDVRNEDPNLWNSLCAPLSFSKSGTIVVTTRSSEVATIMQTKPSYNLNHLNSDACWSLFKQSVFCYKGQDVDENLVEIAKEIVAKCGGIPLALKMVGGVLRHELESWTNILESIDLASNNMNSNLLSVLKLSYDHMPSHLKRCFAFLALFSKNYCFMEDTLIRLWMSLGLINPNNGKKAEDIGKAYIRELQERSMIQAQPRSRYTMLCGSQQGFVIHDLLHDLAQEVANNEFWRCEPKVKSGMHDVRTEIPCELTTKVRYLSFVLNVHNEVHLQNFVGLTKLRAVVVAALDPKKASQSPGALLRIHNKVFNHIKYLRALDLSHTNTRYLPPSIENLRQLRYLNLYKTGVENLPECVCNLYNLEILELRGCNMTKLPEGIRKLSKLRHLNCDTNSRRVRTPYGIGLLRNLQSLPIFAIGSGVSDCDICELKDLNYLCGSLNITGLEFVINLDHAKEASLRTKQYLQSLTLDLYDPNTMMNGREFEEQLLEILEPHPNLESLVIKGYGGSKFPTWLSDISFIKLVKVRLENFASELLPPLGQLPSLKAISIAEALNVRVLDLSSCNSPSLEALLVERCEKLESLVELGSLTSLKEMTVSLCPKLRLNPEREFPPSLEEYSIHRCSCPDMIKLRTRGSSFQGRFNQ